MDLANPISAELLADVERAVSVSSRDRQFEIAKQITNLFLLHGGNYDDEQLAVFGDIFERLIEKIETRALVELGERLASVPRAPVAVMRRLAQHDEAAVAAPVLAKCADLTDDDLLGVSWTKTQAHLLAVSKRAIISETVTDVLVVRGDDAVAHSVAANPGARFSEAGFDTLSSRAEEHDALAEELALRDDVPPHIFCRILAQASEAVRNRIVAAAGPQWRDDINSVLDRITGQLADEEQDSACYEAATRRLLLQYPNGLLGEPDLLALSLKHQREDVVAALSLLTGLATATVAQMLNSTRYERMLFLCKALEFRWTTTRSVVQLRVGRKLSRDELVTAADEFEHISLPKARQILGYWRQKDTGVIAS